MSGSSATASHYVSTQIRVEISPQQWSSSFARVMGLKSGITPYHPQGNGQCERFNRSLIALLSALTPQQKKHWDKHLNSVLFCYNTTPHSSTGLFPYSLMFGQEPRLPLDMFLSIPSASSTSEAGEYVKQHIENLNQLRQLVNWPTSSCKGSEMPRNNPHPR